MGSFVQGQDSDLKVHSSDENVLCVDPVPSPVMELGTQRGLDTVLDLRLCRLGQGQRQTLRQCGELVQALSGTEWGGGGKGQGRLHRGGVA